MKFSKWRLSSVNRIVCFFFQLPTVFPWTYIFTRPKENTQNDGKNVTNETWNKRKRENICISKRYILLDFVCFVLFCFRLWAHTENAIFLVEYGHFLFHFPLARFCFLLLHHVPRILRWTHSQTVYNAIKWIRQILQRDAHRFPPNEKLFSHFMSTTQAVSIRSFKMEPSSEELIMLMMSQGSYCSNDAKETKTKFTTKYNRFNITNIETKMSATVEQRERERKFAVDVPTFRWEFSLFAFHL